MARSAAELHAAIKAYVGAAKQADAALDACAREEVSQTEIDRRRDFSRVASKIEAQAFDWLESLADEPAPA